MSNEYEILDLLIVRAVSNGKQVLYSIDVFNEANQICKYTGQTPAMLVDTRLNNLRSRNVIRYGSDKCNWVIVSDQDQIRATN